MSDVIPFEPRHRKQIMARLRMRLNGVKIEVLGVPSVVPFVPRKHIKLPLQPKDMQND